MAIRLSGLSSNLDTESIVQALVSAYSVSKDNLAKAQTKLSWQKDSWKSMNTKIYSFYSKSLSNMKLSSTYNKKASSVTDATIAKVTSSASAVSGTQTLEVKKLASSGYLTGGEISSETTVGGVTTTGDVTSSSKLSEIKGLSSFTSGTISVGIGGSSKTIELSGDMKVSELVSNLRDAGVNASFDEANQRFFVSAKSSGVANDFTLTASDSAGLTALQSMGLYAVNATDTAKYTKWSEYTAEEITALKVAAYNTAKTTLVKVTAEYKSIYDTASKNIDSLTATNVELDAQIAELEIEKQNDLLTEADKAVIQEKIDTITEKITKNDTSITTYQTTMTDNKKYVILDGDDAAAIATKQSNIQTQVDSRNVVIKTNVEADIDDKIAVANVALATTTSSTGTVRTIGSDSQIILNGATYNNSSNNFNVNGLTIQALSLTETGKPTSITTNTDVDGIYTMIKEFMAGYNELINGMDTAYNAANVSSYQPLTDDEKEAMTDTEVEKWETKIKDSILRKDSILSSVINSLKTDMLGGFAVDGESYSLSSFGINTLSYFTAADNERGAYHIDGDSDDSYTLGKTDKLRAAISNDPETVISFFSQLADSVYTDLTNRMKSSTLRSAYSIYNDKQMDTEYSEYSTKISDQEDKITAMEDYYYSKFTAMETALSKLNSNSSSLSSLLGS